MSKEDVMGVILIALSLIIFSLVIFGSYQWYSLPCSELKTKWYFQHGTAPARCIGEVNND